MEHPKSLSPGIEDEHDEFKRSSMTSCVPVSLPIFNLRSRVSLKNGIVSISK